MKVPRKIYLTDEEVRLVSFKRSKEDKNVYTSGKHLKEWIAKNKNSDGWYIDVEKLLNFINE